MTWTGGRARFFNPYCTARFTIVATVFQFSPIWRAVPCQLNSRVSLATALDRAVVTRAQGSAHGKSSTLTPHRGHSTRRGQQRNFKGNFRMDRSRDSRCFRMSCTSRHRSRQTPQHKSRLPSRSMCTSMWSSVSSTSDTVWAFRRNCFLIKVSMSTSFGPFVVLGQETTKVNRCGVLLKPRQSTTSSIQRASTAITLLGQEPFSSCGSSLSEQKWVILAERRGGGGG